MTNIARTRRSRWVIGLSVSGVFLLVSLLCLFVAAGARVADEAVAAPDRPSASADATVLDVDVYEDGYEDGYEEVTEADVRFTAADGELAVTWVSWPVDRPAPAVGDVVEVAYEPDDPEYSAQVVTDGLPVPVADPAPTDLTGVLTTAGVTGALALIGLGLTALWATRLPRPEVLSPWARYPGHAAYPSYGYPSHGYPGYGAHPGYGHQPWPPRPSQPATSTGGSPDINPAALRRYAAPAPATLPQPPPVAPVTPPPAALAPPPAVPSAPAERWPAPR